MKAATSQKGATDTLARCSLLTLSLKAYTSTNTPEGQHISDEDVDFLCVSLLSFYALLTALKSLLLADLLMSVSNYCRARDELATAWTLFALAQTP